jgi:hypothetical protein
LLRSLPAAAVALLALLALLAACERARPVPRADTTHVVPVESARVAPTGAVVPAASGWDASAGPVMLVHGGQPTSAAVIFPEFSDSALPDTVRFDVGAVRGAAVDLFGHAGAMGSARVAKVAPSTWAGEGCIEWPTAGLQLTEASPRATGWSVGFLAGRAEPVPLDSIEGMTRADSARLAADLTRLASALPADTARTFRGVPFSVRMAYRFPSAPGVQAIVADVVRKLNQEATPLEQHTLLVAERDGADGQARYRVVFSERSAGSEETLELPAVLAAVRFASPSRGALVLLGVGVVASAFALVERDADGRWRRRWVSARTGC